MYCVLVSASSRVQSWCCSPSKERLAARAISGEKASLSSSHRKENSAVRMRPAFPFDQRITATVLVVDGRRSRPLGKRTIGPVKTRSKTFRPLTGASAVPGAHGSPSCCMARTAGKSLPGRRQGRWKIFTCKFAIIIEPTVVECEKRLTKGTPTSSSSFEACSSPGPGLRSFPAAMYRSSVRHLSVYSVLPLFSLDSLTEEQPVLTERVIWRVEEEDRPFVGILGVELLCDHQADRPRQTANVIEDIAQGSVDVGQQRAINDNLIFTRCHMHKTEPSRRQSAFIG